MASLAGPPSLRVHLPQPAHESKMPVVQKGEAMRRHWTSDDIVINGRRLHYTRTGRGDKRPLVLVHGFSDNGLCWSPVAGELESDYDIIMPDMRGHGLSARVRPGEDVDMAADLAEIIHRLGLHQPVVAGHSMGAGVAYRLCVRFPGLAGALILEDPLWRVPRPEPNAPPDRSAENSVVAWAKDLPRHTLEELLEGYRRDHPDWPEELIRHMCESKKQLDQAIIDLLAEKMHAGQADWMRTIRSLTLPLLIITGNEERGSLFAPAAAARIRELNPSVVIVNLPDVGHLIRFDNFPAYMHAFHTFLNRLSS